MRRYVGRIEKVDFDPGYYWEIKDRKSKKCWVTGYAETKQKAKRNLKRKMWLIKNGKNRI